MGSHNNNNRFYTAFRVQFGQRRATAALEKRGRLRDRARARTRPGKTKHEPTARATTHLPRQLDAMKKSTSNTSFSAALSFVLEHGPPLEEEEPFPVATAVPVPVAA